MRCGREWYAYGEIEPVDGRDPSGHQWQTSSDWPPPPLTEPPFQIPHLQLPPLTIEPADPPLPFPPFDGPYDPFPPNTSFPGGPPKAGPSGGGEGTGHTGHRLKWRFQAWEVVPFRVP